MLIGLVSISTPLAAAPSDQVAISPTRVFEQSQPAIRLIKGEWRAKVVVPQGDIDFDAITADATGEQILAGMRADPERFFHPIKSAPSRSFELTRTTQGTGFVVSGDGYIVTNAHVVAPSEQELKREFVSAVLPQLKKADAAYVRATYDFSDEVLTVLVESLSRWNLNAARIEDKGHTLTASTGVTVPGVGSGAKELPVELVGAGNVAAAKDIAVVKANGVSNLPTVTLGDDGSLTTGDRIDVIGYPFKATFVDLLSRDSHTEASITSGVLSAKKTASGGVPVLQTNADYSPGSSGSPLFDQHGTVVGVATWALENDNTARYAVPVSVVKEVLGRSNIRAAESVTTRKYKQALDEYDRGYYKRALPLFQEVLALDPGNQYVQQFISRSQEAITAGKDRTPTGLFGLSLSLLIGIGVLILLLAAALAAGVLLVRRRRRVSTTTGHTFSVPLPDSQPPVPALDLLIPSQPGPTWTAQSAQPPPADPPQAAAANEIVPPVSPGPVGPGVPATQSVRDRPMRTKAVPPTATAGGFCIECGATRPPQSRFCSECGSPQHR